MFGSKKNKVKNDDAAKCCAYCEFSETAEDESILMCCKKKKKVEPDMTCRKYSYDFLKRKPRIATSIPMLDPEALKLDD